MSYAVLAKDYRKPPPPGSPYSVPLPDTEQADRSAIYRNWRAKDDLLNTLDPKVLTGHDIFESSVARNPDSNCLGLRPWDPVKKVFGGYVWQNYATIANRRAFMGVGIVEINKNAGIIEPIYGVGLWCQNRPEWQITGA